MHSWLWAIKKSKKLLQLFQARKREPITGRVKGERRVLALTLFDVRFSVHCFVDFEQNIITAVDL